MDIKAVFLDVDGVLNNLSTKDTIHGYTGIDEQNLLLLKEIVDRTGAKLILTSTWRQGWALKDLGLTSKESEEVELFDYLVSRLLEKGLTLYSRTAWNSQPRGRQITHWLDSRTENITRYVILDDTTYDMFRTDVDPGHKGHIIKTSLKRGLRPGAVYMAVQMLGTDKSCNLEKKEV